MSWLDDELTVWRVGHVHVTMSDGHNTSSYKLLLECILNNIYAFNCCLRMYMCSVKYNLFSPKHIAKRKHLLTEVTSADAHRSAAHVKQYSVCKYSKPEHIT